MQPGALFLTTLLGAFYITRNSPVSVIVSSATEWGNHRCKPDENISIPFLMTIHPHSHPSIRWPLVYFLFLYICLLWMVHTSGIIQ